MSEERIEELWEEIWGLLEAGKSDEAAAAALRSMAEVEDSPELHYLLGISLMDLDEVNAALRELERSVEIADDWAESRSALAWAFFRNCLFDDSREQVARALDLNAELAEAHQLDGLLADLPEFNDAPPADFLGVAAELDAEAWFDAREADEPDYYGGVELGEGAPAGRRDHRGGGRASARETAMRVAAGAVARKVLDHLLDAMQQLDANHHLLVVGEFYEPHEKYASRLDALQERGQLTLVDRYVANEEVPRFYAAADLVIVPYLSATQSGMSADHERPARDNCRSARTEAAR